MQIWQYIIFGLVQGLTEFLPISSSGHLLLLEKLFAFDGDFVFFAVLLHLATLLAVIIALKKEVLFIIKNPLSPLGKKIILATIPTIIIVLIFKGWFESILDGSLLSLSFMFTGVLLIVATMLTKPRAGEEIKKRSAVIMGLAQGIAVIPGISRSGATISTGLLLGESRSKSAKFSFLISIPIILASMIYEIIFSSQSYFMDATVVLGSIIAFVVALVVGIVAIKLTLKLVKESKLWIFSIYLFILSGITLLLVV